MHSISFVLIRDTARTDLDNETEINDNETVSDWTIVKTNTMLIFTDFFISSLEGRTFFASPGRTAAAAGGAWPAVGENWR